MARILTGPAMEKITSQSRIAAWATDHPFGLFVALAYAISWVFWIPSGLFFAPFAATLAHYAGAFGPMVAAMIVVGMQGGSVRNWFAGLFKWRVHPGWYAFALGFPTVLIAVMSVFYINLGYSLEWDALPQRLAAYLPTLIVMALIGGGNEEPGWRGFGLPALVKRCSPVTATLILGVIWAFWHWPILLGNPEVMSGALSAAAIATLVGVTMVSITVHAFWYTWLWNRTGSVLLCILLHASYNTANGVLVLVGSDLRSGPAYQTLLTLMTSVLIGSVVILVIATRGRLGAG